MRRCGFLFTLVAAGAVAAGTDPAWQAQREAQAAAEYAADADYRLQIVQRQLDELTAAERKRQADADAKAAAERIAARAKAQEEAERAAEATVQAEFKQWQQRNAARRAEGTSGGVIVRGNETIVVPPTAPGAKPAAPDGCVWLFPELEDRRIARMDPAGLSDEQWQVRVKASAARLRDNFPFLTNKDDPRRRQLEEFIRTRSTKPRYAVLFSLSTWPELAAIEAAREFSW